MIKVITETSAFLDIATWALSRSLFVISKPLFLRCFPQCWVTRSLKPVAGSLLPAWWGKGLDLSEWCNPPVGCPTLLLFWSWFPWQEEKWAWSKSCVCDSSEKERQCFIWTHVTSSCVFTGHKGVLQSKCMWWYRRKEVDTWLLIWFIRSLRSSWMYWNFADKVFLPSLPASFSSSSSSSLFVSSLVWKVFRSQKAACSRSQSWWHKTQPFNYTIQKHFTTIYMSVWLKKRGNPLKLLQGLHAARADFLCVSSCLFFFSSLWKKKPQTNCRNSLKSLNMWFPVNFFWKSHAGTNRQIEPAVKVCRKSWQVPQLPASVFKVRVPPCLLLLSKKGVRMIVDR